MKVYPAGGALIGPAAHVGPHVDEEARVLREGLAAPDALLGLLPSVRSLMDDQAGLLGEVTSHTLGNVRASLPCGICGIQ